MERERRRERYWGVWGWARRPKVGEDVEVVEDVEVIDVKCLDHFDVLDDLDHLGSYRSSPRVARSTKASIAVPIGRG